MKCSLKVFAALWIALIAAHVTAAEEQMHNAVCVVEATEGNKCQGTVHFQTLPDGKVKVTAKISGLNPNQEHAIHVHEFGDVTDLSGKSAGGHYNPENKPHGLPPSKERHAGDLGNLEADGQGRAEYSLTVDNLTVMGKNAVIGRAIVVHAKPDDGGQPTGNAGDRIGVGVIGIAK
jgi:Cu-Zn family superoxide dismutase